MPSQIVQLSDIIAQNTRIVDDYFTRNGMPTPSFDITGPSRIAIPPTEEAVSAAHLAVLEATKKLELLMSGPSAVIMETSPNDCLSLRAIYHYKIAQALPVGEERSFEDLSSATGLNVIDLRRLLRHAMCRFIFCEPRPGYVGHTATSKLLAESPLMYDFAGILTEELFPASPKVLDALVKYGNAQCQAPEQSAFPLGHNTHRGLYDEMAVQPARNRRWAGAMSNFASMLSLEGLLNGFDWASLGKATVVDVGGAWGPVSVGIAQRFPDLDFVIQDLPEVVAQGADQIPADLRDRIRFMSYDVLEPQPIKDADVYFFRAIFHNWPDMSCVKILRNQIPALKPGARLVINDPCLHEPNTLPLSVERRRRDMDLNMMAFFGSRERTVGDWEDMLKDADSRFHLRSAVIPPRDMHCILDVEWRG